jgi:hypothetical protein
MHSVPDGAGGGQVQPVNLALPCTPKRNRKRPGRMQLGRLIACMASSTNTSPIRRHRYFIRLLPSPLSPHPSHPPTPVRPPGWTLLPCLRHVADGIRDKTHKTRRQLPDPRCVVGQRFGTPPPRAHNSKPRRPRTCSELTGPPSCLTPSVTVLHSSQLAVGTTGQ